MINFKKGPALSLGQSDKVAKLAAGQAIEAGHVVRVDATSGEVYLGASGTPKDDYLGFAINNATDGDVISSGKIGVYNLDGASVVETDKAANISAANYAIGQPLKAIQDTGNVALGDPASDRIIGYVEGVRNLPSVQVVNGVKIQGTRALLGIKLTV
jgi:hypothetical protein